MKKSTLSVDDLLETVKQYKAHGSSIRATAQALGVARKTIRTRLLNAKEQNLVDYIGPEQAPPKHIECTVHYGENKGTIELITPTIPEPEEIFDRSGVDPEKWEIYDIRIQEWTTPVKTKQSIIEEQKVLVNETPHVVANYLVSVKIRPRKFAIFEKALWDAIENIPQLEPAPLIIHKGLRKNLAGELIPADLHLGKMAWDQETGQGDMDIRLAERKYFEGVGKSLTHLEKYKPSKLFYIVGNDLQHYENIAAETWKAHNRLDTDSRLRKVISVVVSLVLKTVDLASQVAPVEVFCVPGNHDSHGNMWLHELLMRVSAAKANKHVTINPKVGLYHHTVFGNLLVVWMHDLSGARRKRAVNDIPHRFRKEWGNTCFVEVHHGHLHKKEEWEHFKLSSPGSCIFRQCSGLTTIDYWHLDSLFTDAVPASEAFLWDSKWGVEANFTSNVDWEECVTKKKK